MTNLIHDPNVVFFVQTICWAIIMLAGVRIFFAWRDWLDLRQWYRDCLALGGTPEQCKGELERLRRGED